MFFAFETRTQRLTMRRNPSVHVHRFPLLRRRAGMVRYVFEYAVFFAWAFSKLTISSFRRKYDLVRVHNLPDLLYLTSIVAKLRGSRIILDLHDPTPELCRTIFRLSPRHAFLVRLAVVLEKCSVGFADVVFTPNLAFRDLFSKRTGFGRKIHIIMNSPSEEAFAPPASEAQNGAAPPQQSSTTKPFQLMSRGLIAERHGLDLLILAVASLAKEIPEVRLDVYGRPNSYLDHVRKLAEERGIGNKVRYHGFRSLEEIARVIPDINHLGVIPNRDTPFPRGSICRRAFSSIWP